MGVWPGPVPDLLLYPTSTGTLTKFTLVLYGTAPEGLPTAPESVGCRTLTSSQACVGESWGPGREQGGLGVIVPHFPLPAPLLTPLSRPQCARKASPCTRRAVSSTAPLGRPPRSS